MYLSKITEILYENNLIEKTSLTERDFSLQIDKISCDSRFVNKNTLFFVKGVGFKEEYLSSAVEKGICAYVSEKDYGISVPLIQVKDIRRAMPIAAKAFYGDFPYPIVGITGTKGKTTVSYMLRSIFSERFGEKVGIITTNEAVCDGHYYDKNGTTPEALELFSILDGFRSDGAKVTAMEVSSQALKYNRVDGVPFSSGIYLNLAPDHISPTEHSSFDDYKAAKKRMLTLCKTGIVNADDEFAAEIIEAASCEKIITTGFSDKYSIYAYNIAADKKSTEFSVGGLVNIKNIKLPLPGTFNVHNALCAIGAAYTLGMTADEISKGLSKVVAPGRLEIIEKKGITVLVDYAHNKSSFEAVFDYVETFYPEAKKICLFGCVGGKALDRRVELPTVACPHSDLIVMTSDDPANEEPKEIFSEVETVLKKFETPYIFIEDREKAVEFAIDKAKSGDVVILAGKGHEKTQIVHGKKIPYIGDREAAECSLEEK